MMFPVLLSISLGVEVDQNGLDSNLGEDSDSLGNSKTSKSSSITPAKEKRKPFFKKVSAKHLEANTSLNSTNP